MIDVHKHFQGTEGIKLIHITGDGGISICVISAWYYQWYGLGDSP